MPHPDLARSHETGPVQTQDLNCHTSSSSSAYDSGTGGTPAEVVMPVVRTGVEERRDTTSTRIQRVGTRMLVVVTPEAAKTRIIKVDRATT